MKIVNGRLYISESIEAEKSLEDIARMLDGYEERFILIREKADPSRGQYLNTNLLRTLLNTKDSLEVKKISRDHLQELIALRLNLKATIEKMKKTEWLIRCSWGIVHPREAEMAAVRMKENQPPGVEVDFFKGTDGIGGVEFGWDVRVKRDNLKVSDGVTTLRYSQVLLKATISWPIEKVGDLGAIGPMRVKLLALGPNGEPLAHPHVDALEATVCTGDRFGELIEEAISSESEELIPSMIYQCLERVNVRSSYKHLHEIEPNYYIQVEESREAEESDETNED